MMGTTSRVMASLAIALLIASGSPRAENEPLALEFTTTTVHGKTFDLASLRGSWVVVNFWATWCAPCRKEMPEFSELHAQRDDIHVIGLAFEDLEVQDILAFLEELPVSYPIALVDVYEPPAVFGVPRVLPTTLILSPEGFQVKKIVGPVTRETLENFIDAAQ